MSDADIQHEFGSIAEINRLIHEPSRLAVMALLYVIERADFTFLMNQTGLSWGNISVHLSKLEEAGYVHAEKKFKNKRPNTTLWLTPAGRDAFRRYAKSMRHIFTNLPE